MMKYRAFSLQITQGKTEVFLLPQPQSTASANNPAATQEWAAKIFMSKQNEWFENGQRKEQIIRERERERERETWIVYYKTIL